MQDDVYNPGVSTIIVEPVGPACNIACRYCYHDNLRDPYQPKVVVMGEPILRKVVKEALQLNVERVKFLWHGGEPMLAGKTFYKRLVQFQRLFRTSEKQTVANHMQTNATLIDDEWAQFFKENRFRLSTSLDGPAHLHNLSRKRFDGRGSFEQTVAGLEKLRKWGLSVGVISTISIFNVDFPDEVFAELRKLGINSLEFNIASSVPGFESLAPDPQGAVDFLRRTFDLWFTADDPEVHIRIFENCIRALLGFPTNDCSFSHNHCREYVAVDELGDFYSCGRFLKESEALLGKGTNSFLPDVVLSEHAKALYDKISKIKTKCLTCEWLNACGGGCAYQRWSNGGFGAAFPQCEIRQGLFSHIKEKVSPYIAHTQGQLL